MLSSDSLVFWASLRQKSLILIDGTVVYEIVYCLQCCVSIVGDTRGNDSGLKSRLRVIGCALGLLKGTLTLTCTCTKPGVHLVVLFFVYILCTLKLCTVYRFSLNFCI